MALMLPGINWAERNADGCQAWGCWQGMLPTAGPTVVISVLAEQQHPKALQGGVHQRAWLLAEIHGQRAWRMPELVRERPEGVMLCSGFPSALEKVVGSFAFQQKERSPFWYLAFLHLPVWCRGWFVQLY